MPDHDHPAPGRRAPLWRRMAASRIRRRVCAAGDAVYEKAGWPGRGDRYVRQLDEATSLVCFQDTASADWMLSQVWLRRQKAAAPLRLALAGVGGAAVIATGSFLLAGVTVAAVAMAGRTPTWWFENLSDRVATDQDLRDELIARRGLELPAVALLEPGGQVLLNGESEAVREAASAMAGEWSGTARSLIRACRALVDEST